MRAALFRSYLALRGRELLRYLGQIEKSQWLPREQVDALQLRKLKALLAHAGSHVPYYREIFERRGFQPERIRSAADLSALPVLQKRDIVDRFQDLRSVPEPPDTMPNATGGATGRPLRFLVNGYERVTRSAHLYRNLRWFGWDLGGRTAYVWGSDVDSREHHGWRAAIRDAVSGVMWLDAFALEQDRLDDYLDRLEKFQPQVLIGYPSSLHVLARRALRGSRRLRLGGVQSSAEMLADPVREDLRRAFGGVVMDRYGCREAGVVSHECERGRLHVNAESVLVESEGGQLLVTTLNNYSMPLIRYRNEDLGSLSVEPCPCGRGLPVMERVQGRLSDVIVSPGGRLIHGEFFTHLFYAAEGVERFQVRQTRRDRLEISIVATDAFTPEARDGIERAVREHADASFDIHWNLVGEIPPGPAGKFRFTISDLPAPGRD